MADTHSATSTSKKVTGSWDPVASRAEGSGIKRTRSIGRENPATGLRTLDRLDDTTLSRLLAKKSELELKAQREISEKKIPPGIYTDTGQDFWVCPESFFMEDCVIGAMITDFAQLLNVDLRVVRTHTHVCTPVYDEKFITGLWFGMYSSTNQRRRKGKQSYELGRTCTFALIVKNVFEKTPELGSRALQKDHFFFGNNEGEVHERVKVSFHIKTKLRSFFNDRSYGDLLYGILNYTASRVGFDNLTYEEQDKVVGDHLIPSDALITSCYTTTTYTKGRSTVTKIRKPNPIRASPLYAKEEMELLASFTSLIFTDLTDLTQDFEASVFESGFSALESKIKASIRVRWETLQRFANRTKIRLQEIRKITRNETLRKANVTPDHVTLLQKSFSDPAQRLVSECLHIVHARSPIECATYAFKKTFSSVEDVRRYLYSRALRIYTNIIPDADSLKALRPQPVAQDPSDVEFDKALKCLIVLKNKMGNIRKQTLRYQFLKEHKIFGRAQNLEGLLLGVPHDLAQLVHVDGPVRDIALELYSDGKENNTNDYITKYVSRVEKEIDYLRNANKNHLLTIKSDAVLTRIRLLDDALERSARRLTEIKNSFMSE